MILKVHSNLNDSMSSKQMICPCKCFCWACSVSFLEEHQQKSCWIFSISAREQDMQIFRNIQNIHLFLAIYLTYLMGKSCLQWDTCAKGQEREPTAEKTCKMSHFQATAVIELSYASCSYHSKCNTKGIRR